MSKKEKWIKNVTRDVTVLPAVGVTRCLGMTDETYGIPFQYEHTLFVDSTWYYRERDFEDITRIFRERFLQDPDYILAMRRKQQEAGEALKAYVASLPTSGLSRSELVEKFVEYDRLMTEFYSFWWIAIPMGDVLEEMVRSMLASQQSDLSFEDLMFVRDELELVREKRERSEIGLSLDGYTVYEELPDEAKRTLRDHAEQFEWISTSYQKGTPLTSEDFFGKIIEENPKETLEEMRNQRAQEQKTLKKIHEHLNPAEAKLIESMQAIMYHRNYQKETVNECQHKSESFLRFVAGELGVSLETMLAHSSDEIGEYLRNPSVPSATLEETAKKRKSSFAIEYRDGAVRVIDDAEEIRTYQDMVRDESEGAENKRFTGSPACKGKASGIVRVVTKQSDIDAFVDGEVLVTVMTSVEYIHIMKRATAIVTDEGGITCHAAIFSREFGVPCIIGTGDATRKLKTGDQVDVDAESGVVCITEQS
jgi:phosphohistidine swiveling domain-containing protein